MRHHIHILGICGTFMAGIATIAKQLGHEVTGSDQAVYPPMSTQLREQGIAVYEGFDTEQFQKRPDLVIIGNAIKRGNAALEYVFSKKIPFISAPQWLYEFVLKNKTVIAVAGTHGKTTTSSLIAWILEFAGLNPGFLIGGIPANFNCSARLTDSPYFVIEADEYDTALYDKRPKFMHFFPTICVINNIEFDHADIYANIEEIKKQFQYLLRTVPAEGLAIANQSDANVSAVIKNVYSQLQTFSGASADWHAEALAKDHSKFSVFYQNKKYADIDWQLLGEHNQNNALAAIAATHQLAIAPDVIARALNSFQSVKRRLELIGEIHQIKIYDDFAHHPTAIATTIAGLRAKVGAEKIIVIMECASYTMKTGVHRDSLPHAFSQADELILLKPDWDYQHLSDTIDIPLQVFNGVTEIVNYAAKIAAPKQHLLIMSNRGFGGIHQLILQALAEKFEKVT